MNAISARSAALPVWQRAVNTAAFVLMIVMNALATLLPLGGKTTGELSDQYPVLLTPPGYVFSIWSVIYALLAGFIVYQWTSRGASRQSTRSVGLWFVLNALANSAWIVAWHYEQLGLSVVIMLVLLATLIVLYHRTQRAGGLNAPAGETLLVQLPFSLYLGWISVATIVNVTVLLYDSGWEGFGLGDTAWLTIGMIVAAIVGLGIGFLYRYPFFGLVQAWALSGIATKSELASSSSTLAWTLAGALVLSSLLQAWRRWGSSRR